MFDTLLIANRGEIACRIARTARRLGMRSVAVYSDADRRARHVAECDAAVRIGPAEAARSYLNAAAIIAAAQASGAQAVHPGYGFLSESPALIEACERAGIVFVGPSREAIRRMGSKIESKRIAVEHGVPVVPGYHGDDQAPAALAEAAGRVGYPVMIKASAGGGGKGMRVVQSAAEFTAALETVRREAKASFGDDSVLLERYLGEPRHLEVQLLGDKHGHLVHLFERECSIQRNHQKVIEEAPAANLSESQREALFRHALAVGNAIGYDSTGTVEFIHDAASGDTFFLEMNTRLQVEHPVTEATVGIDLVEWQLRVAAGEPLAFNQQQIGRRGWAIEARVCAEDPAKGFVPEIGTIVGYTEPAGEGVRVDSGVCAGSEVTPFYDSMLAKVIAFADTRPLAAHRLAGALDRFELIGVRSNIGFLTDLLRAPAFDAMLTTHYIERSFPGGWEPGGDGLKALALGALGCALAAQAPAQASPWVALGAWRLLGPAAPVAMPVLLEDSAHHLHTALVRQDSAVWHIEIGERRFTCGARLDAGHLEVEIESGRERHRFLRAREGSANRVWLHGPRGTHVWTHIDRTAHALAGAAASSAAASTTLRAPMPGLVTAVSTSIGARVQAGDAVLILEAMKMMHTLAAPATGTVAELRCRVGDSVRGGDVLVAIEPEGAT
ncbi:acetyl/propionyl/methylcrotonyl-CoA carboxylase subunit alpha [Ramlibacter albus]|uniref:ATP-grasp domain-containing protein n=1 Tax=Ramlibacter albus TaxID=2079448 RepID=A0A923M402_9BURK|nr:biotin carboxylase N-terminal domain-containing protein [Ramlibacter albus]MBC5762955.1 ATP-grasp domain-containing protein [Ramlibacter albus]